MAPHILVISQCFYPEAFRINDMCTEWVSRGYQVTVLTGIPNYPEGKFYQGYSLNQKRRERWHGMNIIRIPVIPRGRNVIGLGLNFLSFPVSAWFWVRKADIRPDYIFMFETSPILQCLAGVWLKNKLAKKGFQVPLYAYIQDIWPDNLEMVTGIHSPVVLKPFARITSYIYRNCDAIFATSPSFVDKIAELAPDRSRIHYWPQYAEEFYLPCQPASVPELAEEPECFRVMFTGNIGYAQGLDILPATAKLLREHGRAIKFYIVGDGRYREKLTLELRECANMFRLLGRRPPEEIPGLLAWADAAFFSFQDCDIFAKTIPAKLQSYMACGRPILASAKGESQRIIEEAACGYCADIGSPEALCAAIEELMDLPEDARRTMGQNSRQYYESHFAKKQLMDEMDTWLSGFPG